MTLHDVDSLSPYFPLSLPGVGEVGTSSVGIGDHALTTPRFKAPIASRMPVLRLKDGGLKEKAESAIEVASIACAHLLAVAALIVIAALVIYVR